MFNFTIKIKTFDFQKFKWYHLNEKEALVNCYAFLITSIV